MAKSEAVVAPTYDELVAKVDMLTKANESIANDAAVIVKERDELQTKYDAVLKANDTLTTAVAELEVFKSAVMDPENQPSQFGTMLTEPYDELKLSHDELAARVLELSGREVPGVNPETHAAVVAERDRLRAVVEKLQRPAMHGSIDDLKPVV